MKKILLLTFLAISFSFTTYATGGDMTLTINSYAPGDGTSVFEVHVVLDPSNQDITFRIRYAETNETIESYDYTILGSDSSFIFIVDQEITELIKFSGTAEGNADLVYTSVSTPEFYVGNWLSNEGMQDQEIFNITETGIYETIEVEANLYPNPSNSGEQVYIHLNDKCDIKIFDVSSSEVSHFVATPGLTLINTSNFKSGTYFIRIESQTGTITKTLLLE